MHTHTRVQPERPLQDLREQHQLVIALGLTATDLMFETFSVNMH